MEISSTPYQKRSEQHIHSPAHALADELSKKFADKKHFVMYLKMALTYDHTILRRIAGEVMESKSTKNPGALFAYLVKKHNEENSKKQASNNK
jgi:hypothetical protein